MVELITKQYNIIGKRIPIELHLYDNGDGWKVVARYTNLGFTVSTDTGDNMDNDIISEFESIFKTNMRLSNINNITEYIEFTKSRKLYDTYKNKNIQRKSTLVLIENPDEKCDDSFMIGNIISYN